jgi:hypothetical protein
VSDARARAAAWQGFFARFLADEAFERAVRADPRGAGRAAGVAEERALWLAGLQPERVAAFRRSAAHKDEVRAGKKPTRV